MASWKRPESVPYPSIWRTFEGKKEINGVKPKYWVQDATPEYKDEFIRLMLTGFLKDEIISKCSNVIDDEQTLLEFKELWNDIVDEKLALICLTKNSSGQVQLVGGNMTAVAYKGQKSDISSFKGRPGKKILTFLDHITHIKDVFSELGVNEYLSAMGLYILPEFRGQGLATEILRARRELCLAVGLKVSGTIFTSGTSQRTAVSAGFKELVTCTYEDLAKENPDFDFPGAPQISKYIKYMYIRYDRDGV